VRVRQVEPGSNENRALHHAGEATRGSSFAAPEVRDPVGVSSTPTGSRVTRDVGDASRPAFLGAVGVDHPPAGM
jgi:hypothetical protein